MHYTSRYVTVRGDRIRSKVFFSDWKFEKYPHKFQINVWLVVVDMSQRSKCKVGSLDTQLLQVESDTIYVRNLVRGDLRRRADSLSPLFYVSSLPGFNFSRTSSIFRFQLHGEWGFLLKAMRAKKLEKKDSKPRLMFHLDFAWWDRPRGRFDSAWGDSARSALSAWSLSVPRDQSTWFTVRWTFAITSGCHMRVIGCNSLAMRCTPNLCTP